MVEEVAIPGEAKTAYQIAERFFNIWYLMRASRRSRHQLRWLVEFLKAFYTAEEREKLAHKMLHTRGCEPLSHGKQLLALSQSVEDRYLRRELQNTAFYTLAKVDRKHRADMDLTEDQVSLHRHAVGHDRVAITALSICSRPARCRTGKQM